MSRPEGAIKARWSELEMEEVRRGVTRCGFGTEDVLLVLNRLEPGMEVRPHSHDFDQLALLLSGRATFRLDDAEVVVEAGEVLLIPAGVEHCAEPLGEESVVNLDVFAPARADYLHLIEWMKSYAAGPEPVDEGRKRDG